jgi:hypothetical protein
MNEIHEGKIFIGRKNGSDYNAPTPWDEARRAVEEPPH